MPIRPAKAPAKEYSRYLIPARIASPVWLWSTIGSESNVIHSKNRYIVT